MDYKKQLSAIKRKLAANQMSLLVGSGFSKNVSRKFPAWDELLFDLVVELYHDEIETDFARHIRNTVRRDRMQRSAFTKHKASLIMKREGYLKVVTKYLSGKGYAESIASYIEERTPYIHREGDDIILTTGGSPEKIPAERLTLHKALVKLPWNNIYTTNYDELLDFCIQPEAIVQLRDAISLVNSEIDLILQRESELREKLADLDASANENEKPTGVVGGPAEIRSAAPSEEQQTFIAQRFNLNFDLNSLIKKREEKEQQVRNLELSISNNYQVVTFAAGLKLRRNKNIVKLHGSLRTMEQRSENHFEFDGDFKNQYIISSDDYEHYPQKHEAFTQLMRISLLQESFCLIGFSGVDPNFLAWIGWVRDILQKQAQKNAKNEDYKIYLIDVQNEEDPAGRRLFFENHSIIRIPLRGQEVLEIIDPEYSSEKNVDPSGAIRMLLDYLTADEEIVPVVPIKDLAPEQDRKSIWKNLNVEINKPLRLDDIKEAVEKLDRLNGRIFLPDINQAYSHNQHSLLASVSFQLKIDPGNAEYQEWLCRLLLHASKDYMVPVLGAFDQEGVEIMRHFSSVREGMDELIDRNETLTNPVSSAATNTYENILRLAYSMQFDELKRELIQWTARGRDILRKAGFLSIFDSKSAQDYLKDKIENTDELNGEECLYAYEILAYLKISVSWIRDKKLDKLIGHYEHSGFRKLSDNLEHLQDKLAPKPEKITPYGKGRFATGRSAQWRKFSNPEMAAQYLALLAESGIQMSISRVTFQSSDNWYYIFKNGFELYPMPFLYYALQYGGEDFLRRVGQDYAFSEKLNEQLPQIVSNAFRCQHNGPEHMRDHTFYVLAELLNAVDPPVWESDFMVTWRKSVEKNVAFLDRHNPENPFFTTGVKCLKSIQSIAMVIKDCLESVAKGKHDMGIDYLYHLNFNEHFKRRSRIKQHWQALKDPIDELIKGLPGKIDKNLFALGNIHALLNDDQIDSIKAILHKKDFTAVRNVRIWHVILYFLEGDKVAIKNVKQAIVGHYALWVTGISGRSIKGGIESLALNKITKSPENPKGVKWDAAERLLLYNKAKEAVSAIKSVGFMIERLITFTDVLEDIVLFLINHKDHLAGKEGFQDTLQSAQELLNKEREFDSIIQGIAGHDKSPVVLALYEVNRQVHTQTLDNVVLATLLSKALLQHQPGLEATLDFLSIWVDIRKEEKRLIVYAPYLTNILRRYFIEMPEDCNIPFVQERMIRIAITLKRWKVNEPLIDEWLSLAKRSNFNNIKQLLIKKRKS